MLPTFRWTCPISVPALMRRGRSLSCTESPSLRNPINSTPTATLGDRKATPTAPPSPRGRRASDPAPACLGLARRAGSRVHQHDAGERYHAADHGEKSWHLAEPDPGDNESQPRHEVKEARGVRGRHPGERVAEGEVRDHGREDPEVDDAQGGPEWRPGDRPGEPRQEDEHRERPGPDGVA